MPLKKGNSKRFEQSVKAIVQEELQEELEEKYAIADYGAIPLKSVIPDGVVQNGQGNFFKILPVIQQGNSQYAERIGNEVRLKEIDIHGFLSYNGSFTPATDLQNSRLAVRIMILKAKQFDDVEAAFDEMPTDELLRFGTYGGGGDSTKYDGFPLASFRDINRNTFAVRYDKVHYIDAPVVTPGASPSGGVDIGLIPARIKMFREKLKFGKKGLKLTYSTDAINQPTNFPYFMVVGVSSMSGTTAPTDDKVRLTMSCVGKYTDA